MTAVESAYLSIGEVSERTGLPRTTVRFYEQEGLFLSPVTRDAGGRRVFSADDVGWLMTCTRFRAAGMPLPEIRRYVELVRQGPGSEAACYELLCQHEARIQVQVGELQELLGSIQKKVAYYAERMAEGTATGLWRDGPDLTYSE
jgi:DNA-binding transcriptional MerR regulator